jgi:membrane protein implicated in regulation of membrane protease activity
MLGSLYLISLVAGGILLAVSMLGDVFDHAHVDVHVDDPGEFHILTIRSATYFLFVFGATGAALDRFSDLGWPATLGIASAAGIGMAALVTRVFQYLKRSESGEIDSDRTLHGLLADVVVPITTRNGGKISLRRGGERLELLARPFDESDGDPATWRHVRIIDVREGTALVSPNPAEQ